MRRAVVVAVSAAVLVTACTGEEGAAGREPTGSTGRAPTAGDPTGATAELGRTLFDTAVQRCATALGEVAVFDPAGPALP